MNNINFTPQHHCIYAALTDFPEGVLSATLREICKCQNIADDVMAMRRQGFNISYELEPYTTEAGVESKIGRYRLKGQAVEVKP